MFSNIYSQQATILFADGTEKVGDYTVKLSSFNINPFIKDRKTKEKYKPEEISILKTTKNGVTTVYYSIETKETVDDNKTTRRLGTIIYENGKVKLFSVINSFVKDEIYILRKTETVAFNIGYIYGADARPFNRRISEYFTDCPELVTKVKKNEFNNNDVIKIAQFYDENCSK